MGKSTDSGAPMCVSAKDAMKTARLNIQLWQRKVFML